MFEDLITLFSGWYQTYVSSIKQILTITNTDGSITTESLPEVWSAFVPWEALIAAVVLVVFLIVFFRFLRSVVCKIF